MRLKTITLMALAIASAPVHANSTLAPEPEAGLPHSDPDGSGMEAERLALARELVALSLPPEVSPENVLQAWRDTAMTSFSRVADIKVRNNLQGELEATLSTFETVYKDQLAVLVDAYVSSYAREYTADEMRQIIGFVSTPAGKHLLRHSVSLYQDESIMSANQGMNDALQPLIYTIQRAICQSETKARIAAGNSKAKCAMA